MKKQILTFCLISLSIAVKAQTKKEYAQADPNKSYTFTLIIPSVKLGDLQYLSQLGSGAIMDTELPAKTAKTITKNSFDIINELFMQLRKQVVADSLVNIKLKKP